MIKNFKTLLDKMPPAARARAEEKAQQMIRELPLAELREARALTQTHLAELLRTTQSAISKLERRTDMYVSTLKHMIAAMGGKLEIRAVFPDGTVQINQFRRVAARGAKGGVSRRVLVVDDEVAVRQTVADALRMAGYHVNLARNALQAIRCVEKRDYGVIVSDLRMPGMDGASLLRVLRDRYGAECPPMIFLTAGHPGAADLERLDAPVLPKRSDTTELRQAIARALER